MSALAKQQNEITLESAAPAAFKTVVSIMETWGCTREQMAIILGMPKSTLGRYIAAPEKVNFTSDQQSRVSYLLNIYQAIRMTFNNQVNIDKFMSLKNNNGMFAGRAPLDLLLEGSMENMIDTYKHIDALRGGQW